MNHGELAVLFCFLFAYMATKGNGVWSLGKRELMPYASRT